ncbi:unnamed protein product [Prorocentrum cordatum]|uniref:Peptidase M48 domain-containing protein n=1 Tax=Prorocentrum cordatum TaxID=2364126 RepID=A0ABN9UFF5_9DINO|nr:unnamed protein product [Polarella glacialis]
MFVLGGPVVLLVLWFFTATGPLRPRAWLWVFLALAATQVALVFLPPALLLPVLVDISGREGRSRAVHLLVGQGGPVGAGRRRPDWPADQTPTIYALSAGAQAPVAGQVTEWVLTSHAKSLAKDAVDAGSPEEPLLPDSARSSCVDVGSLRTRLKLLSLAEKLGYTGANIYVVDGPIQGEHSNGFCTGFGRFRRICLFDTLLPVMQENEMVAMLAHEIGHDRLHHAHARLFLGILKLFVTLFAMGQCLTSPVISSAFFVPDPKVYLGIVLFGYVWGMIDFVVSIPLNVHSRANEFAADRYSVDADKSYARALGDGLKKLHKKSKANLTTPHPFFVFLSCSHPPLDARLQAIMRHHRKKWS